MKNRNREFLNELQKQHTNSDNPAIHTYLEALYSEIRIHLGTTDYENILEIGSGFGISKKYLSPWKILHTDYLEVPESTIVGGIDVQDLPYKNDIFTTVFGVDVLHHISDPVKALSEIARVANKNSKFTKCIFIEPYVSVLSYPIFKIFHNENTFLLKNRNMKPPLVGDTPEDADQMIPRRIFQSRRGLSMLEEIYPSKEWNIQIRHIHPFAFFATGGLSNPLHSNAEAIRMLLRLENKIGARVLKYMASRMVVIITKL